jgi:ATP/ADP translocase
MIYRSRLMAIFNIRGGEGQLVLLVLAFAILLYTSNVLARTASYALFLDAFDANALPFAYVGVSIFATLVLTIYLRLTNRYSLSAMLIANVGFLLLTLLIYWLGLTATSAPWLLFSLPIYFGVNNALTITGFWNLLGRLYTLQEGKRLFGLLSSGEHLATIAAGFLTPVLVVWLGTVNLFLAGAIVLGAALILLIYITRAYPGRLAAHDEVAPAAPEEKESTSDLLRDHYLLLIFSLFTLFVVGVYFVDNIFFINVENRFTNEDQFASFIGVFFGLVGVLSLVIQLFIAGRVMSRFGVRSMILVTPVILSVFAVLYAVIGTFTALVTVLFWLAVLSNLFRLILDATDSAAVNVLYQPLPAEERTSAQTVVNGVLYPLSIGLAGLFLILLGTVLGFDDVQLTYVLILILGVWLVVGISLGRAYPRRLQKALKQRLLGGVDMPAPDRAGLEALQEALSNPRPGPVIYALEVLEEAEAEDLDLYLQELLAHPHSEVKLDVLRRIERLNLIDLVPNIQRHYADEKDDKVRGTMLQVMAALSPEQVEDEVNRAIESGSPVEHKGALAGLLQSGDLEGILLAGNILRDWMSDPDPAARILAAEVLGEAGIPTLYRPLIQLLNDREAGVQRAALQATGRVRNPKLWPVVVDFLDAPRGREAAMNALSSGGQGALPAIETAMNDDSQSPELMARLAHICGRIGGQNVIALLLNCLDYPDLRVRYRVLRALNRCGFQTADQALVKQGVEEEVAQATLLLASMADLAEANAQNETTKSALDLLNSSLEQALLQRRDNIFLWLSFSHDPVLINQAQAALSNAGEGRLAREQRSYALEVLDLHVEEELRRLAKPLVDELSASQQLEALNSNFPQERFSAEDRVILLAREPATMSTPWLRANALYAAGQLATAQAKEVATLAQTDPDPLIQETAVWILARLETGPDTPQPQLITVEKVIALKAVDFFAQTADESLADLARSVEEVQLEAGEAAFVKDEPGDSLYIIISGQIIVHDGDHIFDHLAAEDVFGEMALLDPAPRSATVTAEEKSHLLRLEQERFIGLLEDHAEVGRQILQLLTRRIRRYLAQGQTTP